MSYDYLLVKKTDSKNMQTFMENAVSQGIGTIEDVQTAISRLFPSVQWGPLSGFDSEESEFVITAINGLPEFWLSVEPDGQVHMITMSRAERDEVELAAKELGLTVLDEQTMEMFGDDDS